MKISEKKTKIMIFNKSGKTIRLNIKVNGILINSYTEYTYLGTFFTPGNTFKKNQIMLFQKVCRVLFGFLREINPTLGAEPSVMCKLFNSLVSPILLFNAEIWGGGGCFLKRTKLTNFETFSTNLFDDTSKHEILQVKTAKIALTAHKESCNLAVRGELQGRFPLSISICTRMISYLYHVLEMAKNGHDLIQASLKEYIEQKCWLTCVIHLLRFSGDDTSFYAARLQNDKQSHYKAQ